MLFSTMSSPKDLCEKSHPIRVVFDFLTQCDSRWYPNIFVLNGGLKEWCYYYPQRMYYSNQDSNSNSDQLPGRLEDWTARSENQTWSQKLRKNKLIKKLFQ